jgi:hypothetical protein
LIGGAACDLIMAGPGYPYMLELFSRREFQLTDPDVNLTPLHFDDSVSRLVSVLGEDTSIQLSDEVAEVMAEFLRQYE